MLRSQSGKLGILFIVLAFFSSVYLCHSHEANFHQGKHIKPGANVVFEHDYDGSTSVGEVEKINLFFRWTHSSASDQVKISLNPASGLVVDGPLERVFEKGAEASMLIEVSAYTASKHYLGIFVEKNDGHRKTVRVFELPINIGLDQSKLNKSGYFMTTNDGQRIVVLESLETRTPNR